ncbi:MAG: lipid-A-disaccharide synthase [Candidatus Zixiibacteriota bacterium]
MPSPSLCLVAGEPSGDLHGALLIAALRRRHPDWRLWGVGSDRMAAAGCDLWQHSRDWAVMGFAEVLRSLPQFRRRLRRLHSEIISRRPDGVVFIDYPGFNLRLARRLRGSEVRTLYYIVPQIWAWGQGRIEIFQRCIDRTIVVFPFEREFFAERGVTVDWVGHPFVDWVRPSALRDELRARLGVGSTATLMALLPGSRVQDFGHHLPVFMSAAQRLRSVIPGFHAVLGLAPSVKAQAPSGALRNVSIPSTDAIYDLIAAADLVLTKTGTATVECALLGTPMVCAFRTGALNYAIGRRLVQVRYAAMPNLIAGRQVVPEFIQKAATAEALAAAAAELLTRPDAAARQREDLANVRARLGSPGAVERAADVIDQWLESVPRHN